MHPELSEQDKPNGQEGAQGPQSAAIKANFWGRGTPDRGTPHPEVSPVAKATASNCLCLPGRVPGTSSPLSGSPMARHRGHRSRAGPSWGEDGAVGGERGASKMHGNGLEAGLKEPAGQIHVRQRCQPGHVLSWQSHGPASLARGVRSCCSLPASPAPPCPAPRGCGFPRESGSVPGSREGASTRAARRHSTPMGWGCVFRAARRCPAPQRPEISLFISPVAQSQLAQPGLAALCPWHWCCTAKSSSRRGSLSPLSQAEPTAPISC